LNFGIKNSASIYSWGLRLEQGSVLPVTGPRTECLKDVRKTPERQALH
jgi:hypothetical protein